MLKVDELEKMSRSRYGRSKSLHFSPCTNLRLSISNKSIKRKFGAILDRRKESEEPAVNLRHHLVPHLEKLNLSKYAIGTSYKYSNRHSESILKIMMGEGAKGKGASDSRSDSSNLASGQLSPATSKEQDTTFSMEDFWADLGVEAPPPNNISE